MWWLQDSFDNTHKPNQLSLYRPPSINTANEALATINTTKYFGQKKNTTKYNGKIPAFEYKATSHKLTHIIFIEPW
jgi:hypothetical protein